MSHHSITSDSLHLILLPSYTGIESISDALRDSRATQLLWLELLVNDRVDLTAWSDHAVVRDAYNKACRWYTTYRSLIDSLLSRRPLPQTPGPVDQRDYRTFIEAIRFAAAHS